MARTMAVLLLAATACTDPDAATSRDPWVAMVGIENQTIEPGPLPGGRDAWLARSPRLVIESFGKIAAPFVADPASPTGIRLLGFFDEMSGGSMFLQTRVASESEAATSGLDYGAMLRVSVVQEGGTVPELLGAASVLLYVSIPGDGPCATGVARASEIDYRLAASVGGAALGSFVTTDQTLRLGMTAVRFVVPDHVCARPD